MDFVFLLFFVLMSGGELRRGACGLSAYITSFLSLLSLYFPSPTSKADVFPEANFQTSYIHFFPYYPSTSTAGVRLFASIHPSIHLFSPHQRVNRTYQQRSISILISPFNAVIPSPQTITILAETPHPKTKNLFFLGM